MYCINCGRNNKKEDNGVCPFCGQPYVKGSLSYEQTRSLNQALHNRDNKSREKVDNAMVFIVLGFTLFIIGLLFLFLSNKLDLETYEKRITPTCSEFWVSMVGLVGGGGMFIYGIIRLLIEKLVVQKEVRRTLKSIQYGNYVHYEGGVSEPAPEKEEKKQE